MGRENCNVRVWMVPTNDSGCSSSGCGHSISQGRSSSQLFRVGFHSILSPIRPSLRRRPPYQCSHTPVFRMLNPIHGYIPTQPSFNYTHSLTNYCYCVYLLNWIDKKKCQVTWMSPRRRPIISSVSVDNAWVTQLNHTSSDIFTLVRDILNSIRFDSIFPLTNPKPFPD